ncbi:MAG: hypothetical protein J6W28_00155 [Clostridia bacterium]|nr:hypothetical protein [Clostridia bacterium]
MITVFDEVKPPRTCKARSTSKEPKDAGCACYARRLCDGGGKCATVVLDDDASVIAELNPFRYRSYYYDTIIGLYYLKSRFYDPETGRFLNADSIEYLDPDTIGGLNLYAYCNNNPVMLSDPSGHSFILTSLAIVGIMTLLGAASGAVVSGVMYTLENPAGDARGFWASVAGGAVSGAIMGAFAGTILVTGASAGLMVGLSAGLGAISGAAGSLTEGAINGKLQANSWDYFVKDVIPSALWGAATGALFGVMTGAGHSAKLLADAAGRPLAKQLTNILRYQVLKKAGGILTENLLGDFTAWVMELFGRNAFNGIVNAFN